MTSVPPPDPSPSTPGVPAGWYPDPATGRTRWWNGVEWTNDYAQPPAAPAVYVAPVVYGAVGYPQPYASRPVTPGNGVAVAAFILGLVTVFFRLVTWVVFGDFAGLLAAVIVAVPAILAIALGAVGIARARKVGHGLPLAIIGLALGALLLIGAVLGLVNVL